MNYIDNVQEEVNGALFDSRFKNVSKHFKELLKGMLCFNPNSRNTIDDCLKNPIFDSVRIPHLEEKSSKQVELEIDQPG